MNVTYFFSHYLSSKKIQQKPSNKRIIKFSIVCISTILRKELNLILAESAEVWKQQTLDRLISDLYLQYSSSVGFLAPYSDYSCF